MAKATRSIKVHMTLQEARNSEMSVPILSQKPAIGWPLTVYDEHLQGRSDRVSAFFECLHFS